MTIKQRQHLLAYLGYYVGAIDGKFGSGSKEACKAFQGTGLEAFHAARPHRFFDVGIAEEHAMTFAAGLAANGYKPVTAIY